MINPHLFFDQRIASLDIAIRQAEHAPERQQLLGARRECVFLRGRFAPVDPDAELERRAEDPIEAPKHSLGPFTLEINRGQARILAADGYDMVAIPVDDDDGCRPGEDLANAHLFKASFAMHEALKVSVEKIEELDAIAGCQPYEDGCELCGAANIMKAAIAEARPPA